MTDPRPFNVTPRTPGYTGPDRHPSPIIGYVEPQTWEDETLYAAHLIVLGAGFVGLYNHPETAAEAVRDAYLALVFQTL